MDEGRLTVLIADGAPEERASLREALLSDPSGRYVVVEAESGDGALELCRAQTPDCLILDHDFSDSSGLSVIERLTAKNGSAPCAILVLVEPGDARLAVEAMKSGAHDCLEKDRARGGELRRAVSQALQRARLSDEIRAARTGASNPEAANHPNHNRAGEQLRLLKTAIEQSAESVIITTAQLDLPGPQIVYVNPAFTRMTGYAPEEVIGKTPRILQGPKTDRSTLDRLRKDCAEGKPFRGETANYRKDGSEFYLEWSIGPVRNERGEITHFVATQRDVTKRHRAEEALRVSEEQFRSLFELSAIGMTQLSRDGRYLRVNRKLCQMVGYSEEEMLQRNFLDITHPDDREISAKQVEATFSGELDEASVEKRYVRKDGEIIWILVNWKVIRDAEGRPLRTVASLQDITSRKHAEEALRQSEAQLRSILDNSTAVMFVKDLEGRYLRINRWYEVTRGLTAKQVTGRTDYDLYAREIADAVRANDREVIAANKPMQFEEQVVLADGLRYFISVKFPLHDESGQPYAVCGIATDITERKRMEHALRASEERLRRITEATQDVLWEIDPNSTRLWWSERAKPLFGFQAVECEIELEDWYDHIHPDDVDRVRAEFENFLKNDTPDWVAEYRFRRADGAYIHILDRGRKFFLENGAPMLISGVMSDITERKQAEESLQRSEERFRSLIEQASDGIFVADLEGNYTEVNTSGCEMLGYTRDELLGMKVSDLIRPEDYLRFDALRESLSKGESHMDEWLLKHKDGHCVPTEVSTRIFPDGRWHAIARDITERKRQEQLRTEIYEAEQRARRQAEDANRMKDEFLATVSHELRSPLNAMLGYARLLRFGPLDDQKIRQAVDVIERSGKTQAQLIDDLLDTARIISGKLKLDVRPVNLVAVIEEAVLTIYPAADAKGISIHTNLNPEAGQITGDPGRLQQVVWNLLSNAVKFTAPGGSVEARLERVDPHICITVTDTGKGISPDFLPYVFDRFRQADASSSRRYGGLGLGLALVKYLVELHGGTIEAASAGEDQGATFNVHLPVRAVSSPLDEAETATFKVAGLNEATTLAGMRALVVDDEEDARELVRTVIAQYGAEVIAARSASEAFEILTTIPPEEFPDVIITDLGMPGEDGYTLIRRVREWERERGLHIPAVALTAYGRAEDRVRALMAGFQMHVAKPVEPAELAVVISSLVRRGNRAETT